MAVPKRCPRCGTESPPDAPNGPCPSCSAASPESTEQDAAPTLQMPAHGDASTAPTLLSPNGPDVPPGPAPGAPIGAFGSYELIEKIAQGGMGVVYKARQKGLNRVVALKMILAGHLASDVQVQRFRHEAELAAALRHPNIVAIYEVGEHHGQHYFSMEYVEGESLSSLARRGALPPRRAAAYVRAIAEAMQYAHDRGTLHRDLKPSNVLIDGADRPRVTDFGLAKRMDAGPGLTVTGTVMGTPSYMSPEQASGSRGGEVGVASDIYSTGAILYELLVGRPPFEADSHLDVVLQVIEVEPVPPRRVERGVPRDLETICMKCMAKSPSKRYETAQALADDLGRWLEGEPIQARPVGPIGRVRRWARRRPVLATTMAAVALFYANHLFTNHFAPSPERGGAYRVFVAWLVLGWVAGAVAFQRLSQRQGAGGAVMFGWGAFDVIMLTWVLLAADGPRSPLLIIYLLLVAVAVLRFRMSVVWFVTGLCMAGYLCLVIDAYVRRPWLAPEPDSIAPFLLGLGTMAIIAHLAGTRLRAPCPDLQPGESSQQSG